VTGGDFSSDKPLLLFMHGFPESWAAWQAQLVYFARLGFPVAAFDMRGYGLSTAPAEVSAYAQRLLVADVQAVVRKLRSSLSQQSEHDVVLVAHDWGAVVGWQAAFAAHSKRGGGQFSISKWVLASAPHPAEFVSHALLHDRFQLLRSWYILWLQVPYVGAWIYMAPQRFLKNIRTANPKQQLAIFSDPASATGMTHYYKQLVRESMSGDTQAAYANGNREQKGEAAREHAG